MKNFIALVATVVTLFSFTTTHNENVTRNVEAVTAPAQIVVSDNDKGYPSNFKPQAGYEYSTSHSMVEYEWYQNYITDMDRIEQEREQARYLQDTQMSRRGSGKPENNPDHQDLGR